MKSKKGSRKILFVCYANMCRSPMAEAILRDIIAKDKSLSKLDIQVDSAATSSCSCGGSALADVIKEMKRRGLDITGHVTKPLDSLKLSEYNLILTMERDQAEDILASSPRLKGHVFTLADYAGYSGDIADPIDTGRFSECANILQKYLLKVAEKLLDRNFKV